MRVYLHSFCWSLVLLFTIVDADERGQELLEYAKKDNSEGVLELINQGVDVNYRDNRGLSGLHWAATKRNTKIVKLLLEKGADINIQDDRSQTPLIKSVTMKDTTTTDVLLESRADPNIKDHNERVALHYAARNNAMDIIKSLLCHGADLNIMDQNGQTAYDMAVEKKKMEVAEFLKDAGNPITTTASTDPSSDAKPTPAEKAVKNLAKAGKNGNWWIFLLVTLVVIAGIYL